MKAGNFGRALALLSCSFAGILCHAAEQDQFDFKKIKHVATVCEKAGVVWSVQYGEDKQGFVVYAIFNKGMEPSPVASTIITKSDGSHDAKLEIVIQGKKIDPPLPTKNSMLIVNSEVKRGHFEPLVLEGFRRFLKTKEHLSLSSLEKKSKDWGLESKADPMR